MIPPALPAHLDAVTLRAPLTLSDLSQLFVTGDTTPRLGQAPAEGEHDPYQIVRFADRTELVNWGSVVMGDPSKLRLGVTHLTG